MYEPYKWTPSSESAKPGPRGRPAGSRAHFLRLTAGGYVECKPTQTAWPGRHGQASRLRPSETLVTCAKRQFYAPAEPPFRSTESPPCQRGKKTRSSPP